VRRLFFLGILLFGSTVTGIETGDPDDVAGTESFIGLCSQITRDTGNYTPYKVHPQLLNQIKNANVDLTRTGFKWRTIHPAPDEWNWRVADAVVASAGDQGVKILALVGGMPRWAADSPGDHIQQWLEFVDSLSTRYNDEIHYWELWNEPNVRSGKYWPQDEWPEPYVAYIELAAQLIRQNQPHATILLGGIATGDKADPFGFWDSVFNLGILESVDGVAYHPYHYPGLELIDFNERLTKLISRYTEQDKQLWVTEFGVPAVDLDDVERYSYTAQKEQLLRSVLAHWATGGTKFYIFSLWDKEQLAQGLTQKELRAKRSSFYGLLEKDMSPKASYSAVAWLSGELKHYVPIDYEVRSDGLLVFAKHKQSGQNVYFCWGSASQKYLLARADSLGITTVRNETDTFDLASTPKRKLKSLVEELTLWK